jgi:microcystin-dependent protein
MSTPYLCEIRIVSWGFAAKGWALTNGQLLPINQNQALFSLLGTTYGGDGRVNFGLPDLRSRFPMHAGQGAGLSLRNLGDRGGSEKKITPQTTAISKSLASPVSSNIAYRTAGSSLSPFAVLNFIIALQGIFPTQN